MSLKENLKMLRKAKGLKQTDLAKIINKQPLTISRYENGLISPPFDILEKLANFYNLTTADLMLDVTYDKNKKYSFEKLKEILQEKYTIEKNKNIDFYFIKVKEIYNVLKNESFNEKEKILNMALYNLKFFKNEKEGIKNAD